MTGDREGAGVRVGCRAGRPARGQRAGRCGSRSLTNGGRGLQVGEPGSLEGVHVDADRGLERLVVGAPVGVRRDELHERVLAVGPDEEVDGGDALPVGEAEPVLACRELPDQTRQRDQRPLADRVGDRRAVVGGIAFALVDGEALVQPARRVVVRVAHRRVEDEMGQLVRDDGLHPGVVDLGRRDQREQRPDLGIGLAADVLARAGSEGVVERGLVGVDEEVDRLLLGDAQQRGRLLDAVLADLERPLPEGIVPLVPVDAHDRAARGLPREALVGVDHAGLWPGDWRGAVSSRSRATNRGPACSAAGAAPPAATR